MIKIKLEFSIGNSEKPTTLSSRPCSRRKRCLLLTGSAIRTICFYKTEFKKRSRSLSESTQMISSRICHSRFSMTTWLRTLIFTLVQRLGSRKRERFRSHMRITQCLRGEFCSMKFWISWLSLMGFQCCKISRLIKRMKRRRKRIIRRASSWSHHSQLRLRVRRSRLTTSIFQR